MSIVRKIPRLLFASFITFAFISTQVIYAKENPFQKDLYSELLTDPYNFFKAIGVDLEKDIITLPKNPHLKKNRIGISRGAIYHISGQKIYLKRSHPFTELMASRLMNLFIGTKYSPKVKTVRSETFTIASLHLPNFQSNNKLKKSKFRKSIRGKAKLAVAQALLGVVDQNNHNVGAIEDQKTYYAARIDLDSSFDYTSKLKGSYNMGTDHLNLKHLYKAIKTFPENEVIDAIKSITAVSDEEIIMTILHAWALLNHTGYPLTIDPCLALAEQIIDRKNAFREAIENKNSPAYKLLAKKQQKHK